MSCAGDSDSRSTRGRPDGEPRLDWFTELWWKVFRWPEGEREAARRDINGQALDRKSRSA